MRVERFRFAHGRDVAASAARLMHWWLDELAAAFPRAASALSSGVPRVELEVSATPEARLNPAPASSPARIVAVKGFDGAALAGGASLTLEGSLDDLDADQQACLRQVCQDCRIDVVLSAPDVFRTSIRLPRAAVTEEGLRYMLQSEAPVKVEYLAFASCIEQPQPADLAPEWVQVRVAMCRRATLDAVRAALQRVGVNPQRIGAGYGPDQPTQGPVLDARGFILFRERQRGLSSPMGRGLMVLLALLAFLVPALIGAAVAGYRTAAVRAEIETIRTQHGSALPLAQRRAWVASLEGSLRPILQSVSVTSLLNDVAQRLGDDVWIQDARIDGRQIRLQVQPGPNVEPDAVVAGLAASPLLGDLRMETLSAGGVGRSIELTATIKSVER